VYKEDYIFTELKETKGKKKSRGSVRGTLEREEEGVKLKGKRNPPFEQDAR